MDWCFFFFQAEDGIRDRSPSRGLGDVYKRQDYQGIYRQPGEIGRVGTHICYESLLVELLSYAHRLAYREMQLAGSHP